MNNLFTSSSVQIYVGGSASGVQVDLTHPDFGKDCGDNGMRTMGMGPDDPCKGKLLSGYFFFQSSLDVHVFEDGRVLWWPNYSALKRLVDAGFERSIIEKAARLVGDCLGYAGGQKANCVPVRCQNGKCGLMCYCNINGRWTEKSSPICD